MKLLANQEGVASLVEFIGQVEHSKVIDELLNLDVYVALSRMDSESFGVAIIEASAAGKPVVVSNVGGLPEVVIDGVTGFVVPKESPKEAALVIEKLIIDEEMRCIIGKAGSEHVKNFYDWDVCLNTMKNVYRKVINDFYGAKK